MKHKFGKVLVHFGGDKTGSTAIQLTLHHGRELLQKSGLATYPPGHWHAQLGSAFCERPELYVLNVQNGKSDPIRLRQEDEKYLQDLCAWLESAPATDYLIFSYEGFVNLDEGALARFRKFCNSWAPSVAAVLYVRPPLSYAVSAMSQRVVQGKRAWPRSDPPISPYETFLRRITSAFGIENTIVKAFDRSTLNGGDVVRDFLDCIGASKDVTDAILTSRPTSNESISDTALLVGESLIQSLSRRGLAYSDQKFHERFGQYLRAFAGDRIRLTPTEIAEIASVAEPHSSYLEKTFGIVFHEQPHEYARTEDRAPIIGDFANSVGEFIGNVAAHGRQLRADFSRPEFGLVYVELKGSRTVRSGDALRIDLDFSTARGISGFETTVQFTDSDGRLAFSAKSAGLEQALHIQSGTHRVTYEVIAQFPTGEFEIGFHFAEVIEQKVHNIASFGRLLSVNVIAGSDPALGGYLNVPASIGCSQISDEIVYEVVDARGKLQCGVIGDLTVRESLPLPVVISNESNQNWTGLWTSPIGVGYSWLDENGSVVAEEVRRISLPTRTLRAGEETSFVMMLTAPAEPGRYKLRVLPLQGANCWWDTLGFTPTEVEVNVVAEGSLRHLPAADVRLHSQVGSLRYGARFSSNKAGFLLHGPYLRTPAGKWRATVFGEFVPNADSTDESTFVDVVAVHGTHRLAKFQVQDRCESISVEFQLDIAVDDLEVRINIGSRTHARVDAVTIQAIRESTPYEHQQ